MSSQIRSNFICRIFVGELITELLGHADRIHVLRIPTGVQPLIQASEDKC